ncbi:MAG: autotransporter outer membrane beta-barrel domain-containing protein [Pseudomonadota bacterium]
MASPGSASDWSFQVTPYAWFTGLSGEVGTSAGRDPVDIDLSFGDILGDLDAAGMLLGSARKGPWMLLFDTTFSRVTPSEVLGGVFLSGVEIESTTRTLTLAAGRRVFLREQASIDIYAGARAWWLDTDVTLRTAGGRTLRTDQSENWIDPIVGVSGVWRPRDRWALFAALEAGGFGITADRQSSVFVGASYAFNELVAATLGWRRLAVDYRDGEFLYDATQTGPVFGATIRF